MQEAETCGAKDGGQKDMTPNKYNKNFSLMKYL